eukprot:1770577-Pyramimonas_sp.AAC.1
MVGEYAPWLHNISQVFGKNWAQADILGCRPPWLAGGVAIAYTARICIRARPHPYAQKNSQPLAPKLGREQTEKSFQFDLEDSSNHIDVHPVPAPHIYYSKGDVRVLEDPRCNVPPSKCRF